MKTAIESIKVGHERELIWNFTASSPTLDLVNADRFTMDNRKDRSKNLLAIVGEINNHLVARYTETLRDYDIDNSVNSGMRWDWFIKNIQKFQRVT